MTKGVVIRSTGEVLKDSKKKKSKTIQKNYSKKEIDEVKRKQKYLKRVKMEKSEKEKQSNEIEKAKQKLMQGRKVEEDVSDHSSQDDGESKEVFDKEGFYDVPEEYDSVGEDEGLFA